MIMTSSNVGETNKTSFKAAKDTSFGGYCCGKCLYYTTDPNAGNKKEHCKRCVREWHTTEEVEEGTSTASGVSSLSEVSDSEVESSLSETLDFRSDPECTNCVHLLNGIESMTNCAACKILCCVNCTTFLGTLDTPDFRGPFCLRCIDANRDAKHNRRR